MSIRAKIVLIVLPLIIAPLLLTGWVSSLSARNGITQVATSLLRFKQEELLSYAGSQWSLLVSNNLAGNPSFVQATRAAVESFARNMVRSPTELILAVDEAGSPAMATAEVEIAPEEKAALRSLIKAGRFGWQSVRLGGVERVSQVAAFEPFGWYILVSEQRKAFYAAINQMYWQTGVILAVTSVIALGLLLFFALLLTRPLKNVVGAMREIISTSDLSRRVEVQYRDETGELGHTFNMMAGQLEKANTLVKSYALQAVVAQHNEQKIKNVFKKYVPKEVIDQVVASPETALVGEDRVLALLFSDVRDFTTISENMAPNELVDRLNDYFAMMVDIIMQYNGIVDKYMGDGIMAFFGAPVRHEDDALQSVQSAFEMLDKLKDWNRLQAQRKHAEFRVGIGIHYGTVTVGNIGSDKKMEYSVIGDSVNLASRLEGLTKEYRQELIISGSVARKLVGKFPTRRVGRVRLKGKGNAIDIFTARRVLSPSEAEAWGTHAQALERYYARDFQGAAQGFGQVQELLPEDPIAARFIGFCGEYEARPPAPNWDGVEVMTAK